MSEFTMPSPNPASLSDVSRYEQACDQAIAMCDGNHAQHHQGADHGQ